MLKVATSTLSRMCSSMILRNTPRIMQPLVGCRSIWSGDAFSIMRRMMNDFERTIRRVDSRPIIRADPFQIMKFTSDEVDETGTIFTDEHGNRKFSISFDMSGFEPHEIKVTTQKGQLHLTAKKEKQTHGNYALREFSQTYTLPDEVKVEDLSTRFTDDCVLHIEAPLGKKSKVKEIPIEHHE